MTILSVPVNIILNIGGIPLTIKYCFLKSIFKKDYQNKFKNDTCIH